MRLVTTYKTSQLKTSLLGISAIFLAAAIIKFPEESFNASLRGLKIWWEIIFPALFPFLLTSELLLSFGVVRFLGVLLEPLMRPLFNVPGVGGFVLTMGFASGYPMGAKLSTRLREQNLISKTEGERLVAFTSTSDPLFIFGAIAVGFFHDPKLGVSLAIIHYLSSLLVGLVMRYYKRNEAKQPYNSNKPQKNILIRAFDAMHQARINESRGFGKLMGDGVMSSIETLLMIGGFIMFFSVILTLITAIGLTNILASLLAIILVPLGISLELTSSLIYGFFEVTLGVKAVSEASANIPFSQKIAIVSVISAWSGISVHAQVAAIVQKTDIKYTPYLFGRIIHAIFAFILTYLLWEPLKLTGLVEAIPTFLNQLPTAIETINYWSYYLFILINISIMMLILVLFSIFSYLVKKLYNQKI